MRFPAYHRSPHRRLAVEGLSGGLNLRDAANGVSDNQLTDAENMWYRGGLLRTRPGLSMTDDEILPVSGSHLGDQLSVRVMPVRRVKDGVPQQLVCRYAVDDVRGRCDLWFTWSYKGGRKELPGLTLATASPRFFVALHESTLYLYASGEGLPGTVYRLPEGGTEWGVVTEDECYAPLILTHCRTPLSISANEGMLISLGAEKAEGYNILGNRYRMIYSTVDLSRLSSESPTHWMLYPLLHNTLGFPGRTVEAKLTLTNGYTYTHRVTVRSPEEIERYGVAVETESPGDGLYMAVQVGMLWFCRDPANPSAYATVRDYDYVPDNLEITAPCRTMTDERERLFGMSRVEWFGGAEAGVSGGTRLFLCGSDRRKDQNLVVWSGADNPLYFPDDAYVRVGDAAGRVTAFGRQSDMLVVFKTHETWYLKYGGEKGGAGRFSLTHLHAAIGCDCPDTVALCRNRLVWAHSDGAVYALVSDNRYNDRSIFRVSEMLGRAISDEKLSAASADAFDGWYLLLCGDRLYAMHTDSRGFQYVSTFTEGQDANRRIPWYRFRLPVPGQTAIFTNGGLPSVIYIADLGNAIAAGAARLEEGARTDTVQVYSGAERGLVLASRPIECSFTTKFFDCGEPNRKKEISEVGLAFGRNESAVTVAFVTDTGSGETTVSFADGDETRLSPGFIVSRVLMPAVRAPVRFGLRFSCTGVMAASGFAFTYRLTGRAR